jgi:predicted transcriptional regulator
MSILMTVAVCPKCGGSGQIEVPNRTALKEVREKYGMSVRGLARGVGYSAAFISDVELGRRNCPYLLMQAYEAMRRNAKLPRNMRTNP